MSIFKGSGVAIITPMKDDGDIAFDVLDELLEFHIANHTDAIIICGTSGEASTLGDEEHLEAIAHTVKTVNGRIPVIAGTGSNNTAHAVMMSQHAEADGADGLLLVTPYYNKATQDGLVQSFTTIAGAVKIPCIMYNVPSRTGTNIQPETAAKIGRSVENIVAIKEASGNLSQVAKLAALVRDGSLDIYSGNDDQVLPICSLGGIGVISVLANVAPKATHDMVMDYLDGNTESARKIQLDAVPLIEALFCEVNPIPVKAAMNMMGYKAGKPRLPLTEMLPEHQEKLKAALKDFGVLS